VEKLFTGKFAGIFIAKVAKETHDSCLLKAQRLALKGIFLAKPGGNRRHNQSARRVLKVTFL
jgi:hypothetical protein